LRIPLFPRRTVEIRYSQSRAISVDRLQRNTEYKDVLTGRHNPPKAFAGEVKDDYFKIISTKATSTDATGWVVVLIAELKEEGGRMHMRLNKGFKVLFSILFFGFSLMCIILFSVAFFRDPANYSKQFTMDDLINSIGPIAFVFFAIFIVPLLMRLAVELLFRSVLSDSLLELEKLGGIHVVKRIKDEDFKSR
jgi:multidrug transporter EmrE-like cation transporter